jgi:hypothetical protein
MGLLKMSRGCTKNVYTVSILRTSPLHTAQIQYRLASMFWQLFLIVYCSSQAVQASLGP